jgi:hypothetical protein
LSFDASGALMARYKAGRLRMLVFFEGLHKYRIVIYSVRDDSPEVRPLHVQRVGTEAGSKDAVRIAIREAIDRKKLLLPFDMRREFHVKVPLKDW